MKPQDSEQLEEKWIKVQCNNCNGEFLIETVVPYMGWRCKWCDKVHTFKKQKEFACDTLTVIPPDEE